MFVAEFVAGLVVVESNGFPLLIRVAVVARRSGFSVVLVDFLMAAEAIRRGRAILGLGYVTGFTFNFFRIGMGALEREIRPLVIERLFGHRGDILTPAFVLRMAVFAGSLFLETPVQTLFAIDILPHIFVAVETEGGLGRFIEPFMAFGAVFFPFGVALNHLSRHERGFDSIAPRVTEEE